MSYASRKHRVSRPPTDVTAPTLVSAIVSNATPGRIDLTWSESVNPAISAAAAFAVNAGHTLTAHTYVDVTHSYLTTSTDFVNGEAARTLAYTQPGSNKMQDLAGNLLANFSGSAITNNVGAGASTMTATWALPTLMTDGTALGTITDQTVYYDTIPRMGTTTAYANSLAVGSGAAISKLLTGLAAATTYYYALTATVAGVESDYGIEQSGISAP